MTSLVTNAGLANVMAAWQAYASCPINLQFGTGSGQDAADTALASALGAQQAGSASVATTNVAGDTLRITGSITTSETEDITEVGAFIPGGDMAIYGDFTAIPLAAGDGIVFQIDVVVS